MQKYEAKAQRDIHYENFPPQLYCCEEELVSVKC